jgi:23S rRNA C2498 (ribose-2'-O)-methylase RlmM
MTLIKKHLREQAIAHHKTCINTQNIKIIDQFLSEIKKNHPEINIDDLIVKMVEKSEQTASTMANALVDFLISLTDLISETMVDQMTICKEA